MLTAGELQAIRERAPYVFDDADPFTPDMRWCAFAALDRARLLAYIDANEGEGSLRCQAVQVLCRVIIEAGGQVLDGTIFDMAKQVEALMRDRQAQIGALTPQWQEGEPPIDDWCLRETDNGARPVYVQAGGDDLVLRYSAAGRWSRAEQSRLPAWGSGVRWCPIRRPV